MQSDNAIKENSETILQLAANMRTSCLRPKLYPVCEATLEMLCLRSYILSHMFRVTQGTFPSRIRQKRINVCHCNVFPYATGVSRVSRISEGPQKLQRHRSVWVGQGNFEKIEKTKDTASGAVNASHLTQI